MSADGNGADSDFHPHLNMHGTEASSQDQAEPSCEDIRRLLDRMAVDDLTITREEGDAFALHVAMCRDCEKAFFRSVGMNEDGSFTPEVEAAYETIKPSLKSDEEFWQDLLPRCPDLAHAYHSEMRRQRVCRFVRRVGQVAALAACIAFLVGGWLLIERSRAAPQPIAANRSYGNQLPIAESASQSEDQLDQVRVELWRLPVPPDVDTLSYTAWRDQHKPIALAFNTERQLKGTRPFTWALLPGMVVSMPRIA